MRTESYVKKEKSTANNKQHEENSHSNFIFFFSLLFSCKTANEQSSNKQEMERKIERQCCFWKPLHVKCFLIN